MKKIVVVGMLIVAVGLTAGCSVSRYMVYGGLGSPQLFEEMGGLTRKVTTDSDEAQRYFDQGLNWLYAFNHDEAVRSFTRAAEIDPSCAMAWWGVSYAQGPNYNDPVMNPYRSKAAWDALQKARAAVDDETDVERALIEALAKRYENPPPKDRRHLERAFSDAMAEVRARFPDDLEIGVMYAEALMQRHPWELYRPDGTPARADTGTIVSVLERVLAEAPDHPGANHLYIHAVEPSNEKDRGVAAADALSDRVPASGHLLHMPSHIYAQVGMWDRSIEQNQKAIRSDARYRGLSPKQLTQHGYMAHNAHMLAFSAMMVGREKDALEAARLIWENTPPELPFVGPLMCSVYDVHKRFGRWDALLAEPAPAGGGALSKAIWRAHRAIAYAARHEFDEARREQAAFRSAMRAITPAQMGDFYGVTLKFLLVSDFFVAGELALQQDDLEKAAGLLEQAVALEDTLGYGEPPQWLQPARHTLGAVYLKDGKFAEAERVYREDLARWPRNGWSLLGLSQSLAAQGDAGGAATARAAFDEVWQGADSPITTSCRCLLSVKADGSAAP